MLRLNLTWNTHFRRIWNYRAAGQPYSSLFETFFFKKECDLYQISVPTSNLNIQISSQFKNVNPDHCILTSVTTVISIGNKAREIVLMLQSHGGAVGYNTVL